MSYRDSYLSLDPTYTDSLERAKSHEGLQIRIDPGLIEAFGRDMQNTLTNGSMAFRKAYLQSLIEVIEVDDNVIRIKGDKARKGRLGSQKRWQSGSADEY